VHEQIAAEKIKCILNDNLKLQIIMEKIIPMFPSITHGGI